MIPRPLSPLRLALLLGFAFLAIPAGATPANRLALHAYFGRYLAKPLDGCITCHRPLAAGKQPTSLADFPHNAFGNRLRLLGEALGRAGKKADITTRLRMVATEDSDGDGVDNLTELLLGHNPGDPKDKPTARELEAAPRIRAEFTRFLASYRWEPFEPVKRPTAPPPIHVSSPFRGHGGNPIDRFLAAEWAARGLRPRPPAPKDVLLRRVYIDLVGLNPTRAEIRAFETDTSPDAYEKVVDRLLADPRYGERWGRHWMDVWRYSDWAGWADGNQIRDSKPFIWRWRDWIVESLNQDKPYDRMIQEMLAADELCPEDTSAQRATGFLVRNYKLLSREQWMEDTVRHTSQAFLGVTMHCAKCHEHKYDPITQEEYYHLRAIFEPHNVRTVRVPGQADTAKDGLVMAFDADLKAATYFFPRGDERHPDKAHSIPPGVPAFLGGALNIRPVKLPTLAARPFRRPFEIAEDRQAADKAVADARSKLNGAAPDARESMTAALDAAVARREALEASLAVEAIEDIGDHASAAWKTAAEAVTNSQRRVALADARVALHAARVPAVTNGKKPDPAAQKKRMDDAEKALAAAEAALKQPPSTAYKPRYAEAYPAESTGRRLAFARWLTDTRNPLTARVCVNHIWLRHFGEGIVPNPADFGRNSRPATNPRLLDWLAAELMSPSGEGSGFRVQAGNTEPRTLNPEPWSMKHIHRLIVTSQAYRMASTTDPLDAKIDPDNTYLWRMSSRRLEAEAVRDNLLQAGGTLDATMGGPEIDHRQALASRRRSIYLQVAAEKQPELMQIFDGPSVTECYERKPSVVPQQALALANSELAIQQARRLARALDTRIGPDDPAFIREAYLSALARRPTAAEYATCAAFLREQSLHHLTAASTGPPADDVTKPSTSPRLRSRENLVLVLFSHSDFVTVR